jgi:hypothetical protein
MGVSVLIRRITLAALVAAFVGGSLALPASSKTGPVASASKCKKGKKGKHKKKKKRCGSSRPSEATLPGQAAHSTPTQPSPPPPAVGMSAIGVTDNPILGGNSTSGQVTINGAAPSGGQPVTLQSSDPSRASVPASLIVPAGQTTTSFPVDTTDGVTVPVTLTASIGTGNVNTQLNVVSDPSVASVTLQRQCFTAPGAFPTNRVTLDVPAPIDTNVALSSSASTALAVPSTVTVPSGSKSALFGVNTFLANPLVTVTAALAPSPSATDTASVNPPGQNPSVTGVTLQPNSVTTGSPSTGTITLDCEAPSGGYTVTLDAGGYTGITMPSSVQVPQDQLTVTFQITTGGAPIGDAAITATGEDASTAQATLHINSIGT